MALRIDAPYSSRPSSLPVRDIASPILGLVECASEIPNKVFNFKKITLFFFLKMRTLEQRTSRLYDENVRRANVGMSLGTSSQTLVSLRARNSLSAERL